MLKIQLLLDEIPFFCDNAIAVRLFGNLPVGIINACGHIIVKIAVRLDKPSYFAAAEVNWGLAVASLLT